MSAELTATLEFSPHGRLKLDWRGVIAGKRSWRTLQQGLGRSSHVFMSYIT